MLKGISPLVSSILLIALAVAVGGIIATWLTSFATTTSETVTSKSELEIICSYGSINLRNLKFGSASNWLSGIIDNNGQISLGKLALSIIYQNATSEKISLCDPKSSPTVCEAANLSILPAEQLIFNVTISGSNYEEIRIITNCTGVTDTVKRSDISLA